MPTTWILAADRAKARLFSFDGDPASITELENFANPDGRGRLPAQDRLPRTHDRLGASRHAIEPRTSARDKADESFARELETVLERGRVDHRFQDLVLIAPPRFLGALNAALGTKLRACVVAELPKGLVTADTQDIVGHLPASMRKPARSNGQAG